MVSAYQLKYRHATRCRFGFVFTLQQPSGGRGLWTLSRPPPPRPLVHRGTGPRGAHSWPESRECVSRATRQVLPRQRSVHRPGQGWTHGTNDEQKRRQRNDACRGYWRRLYDVGRPWQRPGVLYDVGHSCQKPNVQREDVRGKTE